jgi:hypothetical protein
MKPVGFIPPCRRPPRRETRLAAPGAAPSLSTPLLRGHDQAMSQFAALNAVCHFAAAVRKNEITMT